MGAVLSLHGGSWFAKRPSPARLTYVSLQHRNVAYLDEVCVLVVFTENTIRMPTLRALGPLFSGPGCLPAEG